MYRRHEFFFLRHRRSLLSMVVRDFDVVAMPVSPDETNPPLIIDPDRVLPHPIAVEGLQPVSRRRRKHSQIRSRRAVEVASEARLAREPGIAASAGSETVLRFPSRYTSSCTLPASDASRSPKQKRPGSFRFRADS